jgi:hypothetical protein
LNIASETVHPATFTPADSARLVNEHLTAFASALAAQSANAAAQADSTLKLLRDSSLTAAAARDQELAQRLTAISDNTKAALKDVQAQQAMLQQGLAQLQADLAKFLKPPILSPQAGPGRDQPPVVPQAAPQAGPVPHRRPPRPAPGAHRSGGRKKK